MMERTIKIGKTQVILRSGSRMLKAVVIVLVVFSAAALVALILVQSSLQRQISVLKDEAVRITYENEKLTARLENPDDIQTIRGIAEEELDLVTPDTVLIELN